ncbi:MAG TPA: hypothetical protein VL326_33460 [Kofleriaceae bacterium]|nr:hypothetical protein [Kofleriaceae bacterium]
MGSIAIAAAAVGCGKASKSSSGSASGSSAAPAAGGVGLRSVAGAKALAADAEFVRLIGLGPNGEQLDYGELHKEMTLENKRLTSLPPGKPINWAELPLTTATRTFVVVVDAERPAKDVQAAVATLDKACWGFGVDVGGKLGVALPAPCPAGPTEGPESEIIELEVIVGPDKVRLAQSRVNEVETVARADVQAKLAEYKKSEFFKGDPCPATRPEKPADSDEDTGGTGTAMAMPDMSSGRCDVLLAFHDAAKVGDVVDFFGFAMGAGFTEPHWVLENQLPPVKEMPKAPPAAPPPDTPEYRAADEEVKKAQKKHDDAMAETLAFAKDSSKSVADIKAAQDRARAAEEELKAAKKKRKAARENATK